MYKGTDPEHHHKSRDKINNSSNNNKFYHRTESHSRDNNGIRLLHGSTQL